MSFLWHNFHLRNMIVMLTMIIHGLAYFEQSGSSADHIYVGGECS